MNGHWLLSALSGGTPHPVKPPLEVCLIVPASWTALS